MAAGALGLGGATTAKDTAPAAPKGNTVADKVPGSCDAGKTADKDAGKSNLGGDQTDGTITAMAGKGAVSTGKGNTGYYSGGGSGGKKAGTPKQAPKSTENTAVGTTAKKASDDKR